MSFRLMSHNQQWRQEFLQSRSMLLQATEGWLTDIRHIGSTALPGMISQPIIDMLAAIDDMQGLNEAAGLVEGLNYVRVTAPLWCQDELVAMLQKPRSGEQTHSVLIVRNQGPIWRRSLAIQEQLGASLLARQQLENLKREHFQTGCSAEQQYQAAKSEYFSELLQRIGEA